MASEPASDTHSRVAAALGPWFATQLGTRSARVDDVRRHAEGFSWETYTVRVRYPDPESGAERVRGFAIRREPEDGLVAPYDIVGQYDLHAAVLKHAGIPMPDLLALEVDRSILGMPFYAMERLEGRVPVPNEPRPFRDDAERDAVGRQFVDVLARIHGIDWRAAGLDLEGGGCPPGEAPRAALDRWEDYYARARLVELPILRAAIAWLRANLAGSGRLALCHGDYRLGNFMIHDGRIVGIFDWELGHAGDPAEDVAWCALPAFRGRSSRASAMLPMEELLDRYRDATGLRPDPETLRFWTVLGQLKAVAIFLRGSRAFEERRASDIRLAALGARSLYLLREIATELDILPRSV